MGEVIPFPSRGPVPARRRPFFEQRTWYGPAEIVVLSAQLIRDDLAEPAPGLDQDSLPSDSERSR